MTKPCPCRSGLDFESCCEPYILGTTMPETAEALMRSRYTAHATHQFEYIRSTTAPEKRGDFDLGSVQAQSKGLQWITLEILDKDAGNKSDQEGTVTFSARFLFNGQVSAHVERSRFRRDENMGGAWVYIDGEINPALKGKTITKIGRNDPCPCGSGKKFKKCCGAN